MMYAVVEIIMSLILEMSIMYYLRVEMTLFLIH